ncbi:hypothetical protein M9Y10_022034 [Tritrichomonas musculus]|uniref:Uncharacterized protein n=1 Tax=Tritrichomonas musculus TaxID=1915356 RepID=A0ABR2KR45_9EUKA
MLPSQSIDSYDLINNHVITHSQNLRRKSSKFCGTSRSPYKNQSVTSIKNHLTDISSPNPQDYLECNPFEKKISLGLRWYREA